MAGLTKEERAAREAKKADEQKAPAEPAEGLVRVQKSGEALDVHPSCLAAHKALGWVEADA